jgi:hypothetical protein
MIGSLSQKLKPKLLARFPDRGLRLHEGTEPVASFPAAHPEVGDLRIDDDGDELTVSVGRLTHGHFTPRNYEGPADEREEELIERVLEFLEEVFFDRIEFWTDGKCGGWHPRGGEPLAPERIMRRLVWSGPVPPAPSREMG